MINYGSDDAIQKIKRLKFTKPELFRTPILETQNQR